MHSCRGDIMRLLGAFGFRKTRQLLTNYTNSSAIRNRISLSIYPALESFGFADPLGSKRLTYVVSLFDSGATDSRARLRNIFLIRVDLLQPYELVIAKTPSFRP